MEQNNQNNDIKKNEDKKRPAPPSAEAESSEDGVKKLAEDVMAKLNLGKKEKEGIQMILASTSSSATSAAKDPIEAKHHKYQFWETQPVPALGLIKLNLF
jgi:hypothetical protein